MNYKLELNEVGQLNGFQRVTWMIGEYELNETQFYINGNFKWSYVMVNIPTVPMFYSFNTETWGTPELVRDAAELMACTGEMINMIDVEGGIMERIVMPAVDDTLVAISKDGE